MKISPYTLYLEMQHDALLVRQNIIICKNWCYRCINISELNRNPKLYAVIFIYLYLSDEVVDKVLHLDVESLDLALSGQ
jgi:hypothetical protein